MRWHFRFASGRPDAARVCVCAVAVKPRVGSVLVLGCFFNYSAHQIALEAQIEALLPHSIPFRSPRRALDSALVALARTRCWWSLYVPPLGRASWAQAKAWQAACLDQPETPRAVMLARPASTNTVFS